MSIKKITSLVMLWDMMVMVYTGVILFISPHGRIANWADWKLFALSKDQYSQLHSTFMTLFILATILHLFFNFKAILSYLKDKSKKLIIFTKEMVFATALTLLFIIGTLSGLSPFSDFIDFGSDVKDSWEKDYGTAPYSHAELSSLKVFIKKLSYEIQRSEEVLKSAGIRYELNKSLSQIAKENLVTPKYIYDILKNEFEKDGSKNIPLTGLGKKKIKDVALSLDLSSEDFLKLLNSLGIKAKENDKFKNVVEKYDLSPIEILKELGFVKENKKK